ncbi:MAG: cyclase family protein [Candidatus Brocadiia bacterium]
MGSEAKGLLDLTLSPTDAVSRAGLRHMLGLTVVEMERWTPTAMQRISNVRFSPHALTHVDLPDSVGLVYPGKSKRRVAGTTRWAWWEAVVVNVRAKRAAVERLFSGFPWPVSFRDLPRIVELLADEARRKELCERLRISAPDLARVAKKTGGFEKKLVIIDTGWDYFVPRVTDLRHPYWAGLHPYLLFPYLDGEAVEFLLESGAVGVATDSTNLEAPEWMWSMNPLAAGWPGLEPQKPQDFGPVHRRLLSRRRAVVENLSIPAGVYAAGGREPRLAELLRSRQGWEPPPHATGQALLLPFVMSPQREAVVAKVYFHSDAWDAEGPQAVAEEDAGGGQRPLVILDVSVLMALARPEDLFHQTARAVFEGLGGRCDFAVCQATLEQLDRRLRTTRTAVRLLETVAAERFDAVFTRLQERTFVHHFLRSYRNSYDAFVFETIRSLSRLVREHGIAVLAPAYDSCLARRLRAAARDQGVDADASRAGYVARLIASSAAAARRRSGPATIWTLHPKATAYELIAKLEDLGGLSLGVGPFQVDRPGDPAQEEDSP